MRPDLQNTVGGDLSTVAGGVGMELLGPSYFRGEEVLESAAPSGKVL